MSYLGIEAIGLIGFVAFVQSCLSVLDTGLSATITRELSLFSSGKISTLQIRQLLRSCEVFVLIMACIAGGAIYLLYLFASRDEIAKTDLRNSLSTIALPGTVLIVSRFAEGIYRSSLIGLDRQVTANGLTLVASLIKNGGTWLGLALIDSTIWMFFLFQALTGLLSLVFFLSTLYQVLPRVSVPVYPTLIALRRVFAFARGIVMTSILSLIVTQSDKAILVSFSSLADFGMYVCAGTVAGLLNQVITPVYVSFYPRLVASVSRNDASAASKLYHLSSQLISVTSGSLAVVLIVFTEEIVFAWTGDCELAKAVVLAGRLLVLGNLFNCIGHMPYALQLAHGWTGIHARLNFVSVLLVIPCLFMTIPHFGTVASAYTWAVWQGLFLCGSVGIMNSRLLEKDIITWMLNDVIYPLAMAILPIVFLYNFRSLAVSRFEILIYITICFSMSFLCSAMGASLLRHSFFPKLSFRSQNLS